MSASASESKRSALHNPHAEARILLSLASMTRRQITSAIVNYKRRFGTDIRKDICDDKSISVLTKKAVRLLFKGRDRVGNMDLHQLTCLAVESRRGDLLQLVALIESVRRIDSMLAKDYDRNRQVSVAILSDYQNYSGEEGFISCSQLSELSHLSNSIMENASQVQGESAVTLI